MLSPNLPPLRPCSHEDISLETEKIGTAKINKQLVISRFIKSFVAYCKNKSRRNYCAKSLSHPLTTLYLLSRSVKKRDVLFPNIIFCMNGRIHSQIHQDSQFLNLLKTHFSRSIFLLRIDHWLLQRN